MAEFKLDRFQYRWRGDWTSETSYRRDDIVRIGGKSYVALITHVASSTFRTDLDAILPGSIPPQPQPKWTVMTNGFSFIGDYTPGTDYNLGDIVKIEGTLWVCSVNHNASSFANDADNWILISSSVFVGSWTGSTSYAPGQIVKYNGNLYKCLNAHNSSSILEDNADDWELYFEGVNYQGIYTSGNEYRLNDFVQYGASIYRCIETHTASDVLDSTKFAIEIPGSQNEGLWNNSTNYNIGDIVRHQGFMYYANTNNVNSKPYSSSDSGNPDWILLARNTNFIGAWTVESAYKTGDVVLRGGNLYLALRDIGAGEDDGSSLDYLENDTWELLIPGKSYKGQWTTGNNYSVGDVVVYKGTSYVCSFEHEASFVNFPGDNGSGYEYWDIIIQAGQPAALEQKGDLLTFGQNRQFDNDGSTVFDDSTFGSTRLPIGETEQLLSVNENLDLYWRNITEDSDTIFVATNGIDAPNRGTFQKPFKTIKYAAEYVEDNFTPLTPVIIRVSAGKFEEISPIIVPAGCAINGDELRSTTVLANTPITEYQNDYTYVTDYLSHLQSFLLDLITGVAITPSVGNTVTQITIENTTEFQRDQDTGEIILDELGNPVVIPSTFPVSDLDSAIRITELIATWQNYVEFNIADGDTSPTMTSTNTLITQQNFLNAADALELNLEFIQKEIFSYLTVEYPNISFDELRINSDINSLIRGIKRDIRYSGNYATIISAQRYSNAVNGSASANLFFMRDSTGLRDMTTGGLQGVLNPPGVFELYQKPTGGALVSLDPGWGPEDERTWIKNRSPYIQGVTNTGTGCVGMKVDGALHGGGNKSMTANDFTQVLSDGIGAWITNNARAELVSVFTYYCQVGYFAENGGIIRSANGNNSYGTYGSIADGIDDTEVPQICAAFNQNNEAQVSEAFAGGTNDEIKVFEYSNAGQNYTSANATIIGAGADAAVEYTDFRDGGIFEVRSISPDGSSNAGGAGYLRRQGNAQETPDATSTIKLAATDVTQFESEILGMRIVITAGLGVGQYGYVDGFTFATKDVTVKRDSDDQLGWDHLIPGTPLVSTFDLTTKYRIEPRVTVPAPGYSSVSSNLITNRSYVDMAFGTITESYTGVTAGGTAFWRDDVETKVQVSQIISNTQVQFLGSFFTNPNTPFEIQGRESGATATITTITANTGTIVEGELDGNGASFIVGEELDLVLTAGTGNTFDDVPVAAEFNITRKGTVYNVTLSSSGSGYSVNNKIIISGELLGGATPDNDLRITVTEVSDDSTSSILNFTTSGTGRGGRFVSLTSTEYSRWSDNGITFNEIIMPFNGAYNTLISGNDKFLAVASGESKLASSLNGISWSEVTLPLEAAWADGVYGNEKFVLVATDTDVVASSTDGTTWTTGSIPDDTDGGADSTESQWGHVAYGSGKYVAVSVNDLATATSTDGTTWTRHDSATPDFTGETIVAMAYGNSKFVIVTDEGKTAYSFDGITWYTGTDLFTINETFDPIDLKYAQGVFAMSGADGAGPTANLITSEDGILWENRVLSSSQSWGAIAYGKNNWILKANAASTDGLNIVSVGARAKLKCVAEVGSITEFRVIDPGSGYDSQNPPTVTVTNPETTFDVATLARVADNVLAQPEFTNRGAGYRNTSSTITITGDGFADIIPTGNTITISGAEFIPGPGVQIQIEGIEDPLALVPGTLYTFSGVTVTDLGDDGLGTETNLVQFQISPRLDVQYLVEHGAEITLREKYSQCRVSGHDFLDIGTGNFEQTNYPSIYADGSFFTASPENEVYEANGGRVFYVSTDQDGNFRTGELFSVQQSTGIVTISAEFFDLDGLSELALGGVRLGGSGTVVNEFSTDPTFAADSNNVIPTQRAIATFLADRLSVGGESLEVNKLQAGRVLVGGSPENELNTNTGQYIIIPSDVVFDGTFETNDGAGNITTEQTAISGTIVSQMLYFKGFDESMQ